MYTVALIRGASDVIESIFGKYKRFSQRCPMKEMGVMVLIMVLVTVDFTGHFIQRSLETIQSEDVKSWKEQGFGQSTFSKRKVVFSS